MATQAQIQKQEQRYQSALDKVVALKSSNASPKLLWRAMESAAVDLNALTVMRMEAA